MFRYIRRRIIFEASGVVFTLVGWLGLAGIVSATPPPVPEAPKLCQLGSVVTSILGVALGLAGLAVFIMFVYGAFRWLTAGANEKVVQEAKGTLTWAVIGLVLMLASFFILQLIYNFTGVDVTVFEIPWIEWSGGSSTSPCEV
jgi:hypothetical protein